jgi:glycosyltransferase involved in cell wall biosynthesis
VSLKVALVGYKLEQPSFRYRMAVLLAPLTAAGFEVRCEQLPARRYGLRTWERRALWAWADVVVLQQIKLSAPEAWLLARLARHCVFDLDDAIYVRKPRGLALPAEDTRWRRAKFRATCRAMDAVVVGNEVLARAARPASRAVEILPTALDPAPYRPTRASAADPPTVVWIGSPENLVYLELLRGALARLARRLPGLKLRVVCSAFPDWPEVPIERVPWSPASEVEALASAHVGVMPLSDDEWARGKCAFKLLQYMAACLPCVASPVGANCEAVIDGVTGFHAPDEAGWESTLERLLTSAPLRAKLGAAGRTHLERNYSLEGYTTRYTHLLTRLVRGA